MEFNQETSATDDELSLGSLAGIFYILIIGLVLAIGVAFVEFCYNSKKDTKNTEVVAEIHTKFKMEKEIYFRKMFCCYFVDDTVRGNEGKGPNYNHKELRRGAELS